MPKRAHQAKRSGCRSESEILSFGASLSLVYITRQIIIYITLLEIPTMFMYYIE